MTALCPPMEDTFVQPTFEGIDPPLLDPQMVEHFNNSSTGNTSDTQMEASTAPAPSPSTSSTSTTNLQNLPLDELIKLVAQLCETDPSLSDQIINALNLESSSCSSAAAAPAPEPAVPDTNSILKTLNQSILLQELNSNTALQLPTSLALQLASSTSNNLASTLASLSPTNPALYSSDTLEAMKSNLFVMEKAANKFVPINALSPNSPAYRRPGPKYSRKNFSPEQIEGLEAAFQVHRFVKKDLRKQLAKELSLSERSISYWFQNKRARSKPPITMSSEAALRRAAEEKAARELLEQGPQQGLQQSLSMST